MSIRKLLLESVIVLTITTCIVVGLNSFEIHHNTTKHFSRLQEQYFDATYEIYKDKITGGILVGDKIIVDAVLKEIADVRNIGLSLSYKDININTGNFLPRTQTKTYVLDLGNENKASLVLHASSDLLKNPWATKELGIALLLEILALSLGFTYLMRRFNKRLLTPLADLVAHLKPDKLGTYQPMPDAVFEVKELSDTLKQLNVETQKKAFYEAEALAAKQVGHDIRSPLASLSLLLSHSSLPEEQRTLMRSAVCSIGDIANSLYSKGQKVFANKAIVPEKIESYMISSLVDALISEKRIQLRDKENIQIDLNIEKSYGLFAKINSSEFKRVLSNLINNSVEAFDGKAHCVYVTVKSVKNLVQITIQDDGKGIPAEIIGKVGQPGFSYGKEAIKDSGSGLGINHAIKVIKSFGGNFAIESQVNVGTTVTITLPQDEIPNWFVKELRLNDLQKIIILDDDQSIHNLWRDRFSNFNKGMDMIYFSSANQFRDYYCNEIKPSQKKVLFLMDYELLNQNCTGLDLIAKLGIAKQAVLVTSYYEDPKIREIVDKLGVRMIPKGIAAFVPIMN